MRKYLRYLNPSYAGDRLGPEIEITILMFEIFGVLGFLVLIALLSPTMFWLTMISVWVVAVSLLVYRVVSAVVRDVRSQRVD